MRATRLKALVIVQFKVRNFYSTSLKVGAIDSEPSPLVVAVRKVKLTNF